MAVAAIFQTIAFGQKKYEMVIEKTDGSETVINVEDNVRTYFRERTNTNVSYTTCPDNNHPHMIDLGLPSGTKWACCNVGASAPEDYGNYYAWGETQPKSVYNRDTYQYYQNENYVNIGSDIAGTRYDAATANWGAPWRMPTWVQCQELIDNTTSVWTTQNGVDGRKFTGPNGGTVFLPAAGFIWNGVLDRVGSHGHYWSSTLDESDSSTDIAYRLGFYSDRAYWSDGSRYCGRSVRPVR